MIGPVTSGAVEALQIFAPSATLPEYLTKLMHDLIQLRFVCQQLPGVVEPAREATSSFTEDGRGSFFSPDHFWVLF